MASSSCLVLLPELHTSSCKTLRHILSLAVLVQRVLCFWHASAPYSKQTRLQSCETSCLFI
eukprot:m.63103 g.63103  ORF g.63103 m.63103 type:complete len:61 (+) comp7437_c0_seq1:1002-1184(+)